MSFSALASFGYAFLTEGAAVAAEAAGAAPVEEHHGVSAKAERLLDLPVLTNSILTAAIVCCIIIWFVSRAMKQRAMLPGKRQNFVEMLVEFLYNQVENIVGPKVAPKAFPLLATIFIYTLISNYFALLPGVGSIGFSSQVGTGLATHQVDVPLLRANTADMNMTIGMAAVAMIVWFGLTIKEIGFMGFISHTFGVKGGVTGMMRYGLMPIFILVGFIELFSMAFRPVTLSFRLYGNNYAGESLIHTMGSLVNSKIPALDFIASTVLPIPFYFLELLVGAMQALVFALLVTVYIKLTTTHDEEHGDEGHGHHAH
jgi:F-type H+-transporting ATPase subunit a